MLSTRVTRGRRALTLSPLLALALITAACGGTTASQTPPAPAAHPHAHTSSSSTATTDTTTSTTTTTDSTSTDHLPGDGTPTFTIGDKNYTEQFVLGQLYLQALEAQGYTVNINQNIGPTDVTLQALKSGALAMYPEYLYVLNSSVAHADHGHANAQDAFDAAQQALVGRGLVLLNMTPFSDTFGVAVTDAYGAGHRLHTLGDLQRVAGSLTIGGEAQLKDAQLGLPRLDARYGVKPASFKALAAGDQYSNLTDGTVKAAYVNTTDGELATGFYRLLRDPKQIFGYGNVVPVVSQAAINAEGPAFVDTIDRVDALLTTRTMRELNLLASVGGQSPSDVAKQFLQTHGLIPVGSS
ncbi:MAG TPA: glycine betaine ABC transporter substrate-binding protein [Solirubrobacteraceae bacterium]|nr:glycine betaine ABC transporter substrate-binding protein [Solirubrobacteraceae bacterium]